MVYCYLRRSQSPKMNTPNQKCADCRKPLPKRENLKCMTCKKVYDLECARVSEKLFNIMERKDQWSCPDCLTRSSANITPSSPKLNPTPNLPPLTMPTEMETANVTLRNRPSRPITPPGTASHVTGKCEEDNTIDELKAYLTELIHSSMHSVKEAISDLTSAIRDQNKRIEQLEARVSLIEKKSEEIQIPNTSVLELTIAQLKAEISDRDQSMLSNDVEIAGCPEYPNENCIHLAQSIAKKIGLDLDEKDIVNAYRAGPVRPMSSTTTPAMNCETTRPRPLVVRLARTAPRDAMLRAARVRRNLTTEGLQLAGPLTSIYINERLTKHNRLLFQKARSMAREMQFKFVWTRDGRIFVCQGQGKPKYRIRTEDDLPRVFDKKNI